MKESSPPPSLNPLGIPKVSISVALCTYNGINFIEQQIISILEQTVPVDEIVISDDGSTDGTIEKIYEIVGQKKADTPIIRILQEGRLGITKNFDRALKECSGDIIFLSDQDDIWLPDKVLSIINVFNSAPNALLAFSNAHIVDERAEKLGLTQFQMTRINKATVRRLQGNNAFCCLLRRNVVTGATVAFRRPLLKIASPFVDGWLHDEWLAIIAAALSPLAVVEQPLILYRQHNQNQCGMKPASAISKINEAMDKTFQACGQKRLTNLIGRLNDFSDLIDKAILRHAQNCLAFEEERNQLLPSQYSRLFQICKLMMTGQYYYYADGWRSAIKDALAKYSN